LRWQQHVQLLLLMLGLAFTSGTLLREYTSAAWPFVDSFTTWASVITTVLVVRKVLENWLYWLLIDSISLYLYIDRGLHLTALLFAGYLVIVVFGYMHWRRVYLQQ
jgi:nicotinamide mononucleotide transporter